MAWNLWSGSQTYVNFIDLYINYIESFFTRQNIWALKLCNRSFILKTYTHTRTTNFWNRCKALIWYSFLPFSFNARPSIKGVQKCWCPYGAEQATFIICLQDVICGKSNKSLDMEHYINVMLFCINLYNCKKKWLLTCAIILLNILLFYKLIMLEYLLRVVMYVKHFIKHCLKLSENVNIWSGVAFSFIKLF